MTKDEHLLVHLAFQLLQVNPAAWNRYTAGAANVLYHVLEGHTADDLKNLPALRELVARGVIHTRP